MRGEDGFTLTELMIAAALSVLILGLLAASLFVANRTQVFSGRQSDALDDARVALRQLERDVRNAGAVRIPDPAAPPPECDPVWRCLVAVAGSEEVRFRLADGELLEEKLDLSSGTFELVRVLARGVANIEQNPAVPLFACDTSSVRARIVVDLLVQPDPNDPATYRVGTTLRPRNAPGSC